MSHVDLLPLLLPPVSYDPKAPKITISLTANGLALDRAEDSGNRVRDAVTPFGAGDLLQDWERVLALTPPPDAGYQQRQARVIAKLRETGGLSRAYFIGLAAGLGYTISTEEPQPFRAGLNRAGDRLHIEDVMFTWRVDVQGHASQAYRFRAGQSAASEYLTAFSEPVLEAVIEDLKPAHTLVYFTYQEAAA